MRVLLIAVVIGVAGCAAPAARQVNFHKNAFSMSELERDQRECAGEGDKAAATADWRIHNVARVRDDVMMSCMKARGWQTH